MTAPRWLGRWALVAAMSLMAVALLATAWAAYSGVRDASALMIRGEVGALVGALRADLIELGRPPVDADLTELVDAHAAEGLAYVATLDAHGIEAQGGKPSDGLLESLTSLVPGAPVQVGDRVRFLFRVAPRRRPGRPPAMVI